MVSRKMPSLNLKGVMQAETSIFTTTLSYLNKTAYIRLSSTCLSFNQALNRSLIIRKPDSLEQDLKDQDEEQDADTTISANPIQGNIGEEKQCRVCKEAFRHITSMEQYKVKLNT